LLYTGDITGDDVKFGVLIPSGIDLSGTDIAGDIAGVLNNMSLPDLPAIGTVYSVTDFGGGFTNVCEPSRIRTARRHPASPTR
jgi:hypothetical protein